MIALSLSVRLSRGRTRLHCTKTADRIKIPFGVNTLGGPRKIVLDEGPNHPQLWGERVGKVLTLKDPLLVPRIAIARNLKLCAEDTAV